MRFIALFSIFVTVSASLAWVPEAAAADAREMKAREAFAAGLYQDALDVYVKLYAEQLNPIFLRNIGRCYQNLGDADKSISSFREYLRKARKLSDEERAEINGYIAEMSALKEANAVAKETKESTIAAASAPAPAPTTPTAGATSRAALEAPVSQGQSPAPGPAVSLVAASSPTSGAHEAPPLYQRWWFWAIVGGVVAAGFGGAAAGGVFTSRSDAICGPARTCPP